MRNLTLTFLALVSTALAPSMVQAQADLKIDRISRSGDRILLRARNDGDRGSPTCNMAAWVQNDISKQLLVNRLLIVPPIDAGGVQTMALTNVPRLSNLLVTAQIDSTRKVDESNERNNRIQRALARAQPAGTGAADLIVSDIHFHSPTLISVTVRNQGTTTARGPFSIHVRSLVDGRQTFSTTKSVAKLDAKKYRIVGIDLSRAPLKKYSQIHVNADSGNLVRESNEKNNKTLQVYGG